MTQQALTNYLQSLQQAPVQNHVLQNLIDQYGMSSLSQKPDLILKLTIMNNG
jgi:hypothetical protein